MSTRVRSTRSQPYKARGSGRSQSTPTPKFRETSAQKRQALNVTDDNTIVCFLCGGDHFPSSRKVYANCRVQEFPCNKCKYYHRTEVCKYRGRDTNSHQRCNPSESLFVRTIRISTLITDRFHIINLCQRLPNYNLRGSDIPRGLPLSDSFPREHKISILSTPVQNTIPLCVNSSQGARVVHQVKSYSPWIIKLNALIQEPVVSINFVEENIEIPA